jgi:hypothetical protein
MKSIRILWIIVIILLLTITGAASCSNTAPALIPYIPPRYLESIETTSFDLVYAYFRPQTRANAEKAFNDKYVIIKNIKLTQEIIDNKTDTYLNLGGTLFIKLQDMSDLERFSIGEKIDVVGICLGIPPGGYSVVLEDCLIEAAGVLPLPQTGEGGGSPPLY